MSLSNDYLKYSFNVNPMPPFYTECNEMIQHWNFLNLSWFCLNFNAFLYYFLRFSILILFYFHKNDGKVKYFFSFPGKYGPVCLFTIIIMVRRLHAEKYVCITQYHNFSIIRTWAFHIIRIRMTATFQNVWNDYYTLVLTTMRTNHTLIVFGHNKRTFLLSIEWCETFDSYFKANLLIEFFVKNCIFTV